MKDKPAFLTEWRARDLGLFEMGVFSSAWAAKAADMVGGERADGIKDPGASRGQSWGRWDGQAAGMSPTAGAVASAVAWGVFVLWWTGVIGEEIRPGVIGGELVVDGVDWGLLVNETVAWIWWPMLAFGAARAAFHLMRAAMGAPVRFTAFGDVAFSIASLGFIGWFWLYSPMAPVFAVDTLQGFVDRVRAAVGHGRDGGSHGADDDHRLRVHRRGVHPAGGGGAVRDRARRAQTRRLTGAENRQTAGAGPGRVAA